MIKNTIYQKFKRMKKSALKKQMKNIFSIKRLTKAFQYLKFLKKIWKLNWLKKGLCKKKKKQLIKK